MRAVVSPMPKPISRNAGRAAAEGLLQIERSRSIGNADPRHHLFVAARLGPERRPGAARSCGSNAAKARLLAAFGGKVRRRQCLHAVFLMLLQWLRPVSVSCRSCRRWANWDWPNRSCAACARPETPRARPPRLLHGAGHEHRILRLGDGGVHEHPSQPSSIAMAASEAVPTPASTSTGTRA